MSAQRLLLYFASIAFGLAVGLLGVVAERYAPRLDKLARCEAWRTPLDCHRDWIGARGEIPRGREE